MTEGVYVREVLAELIKSGEKTAIVSGSPIKCSEGKVLVGGRKALGIVKLGSPEKISGTDFDERAEAHMISKADKKKLWPRRKILFFHEIESFTPFSEEQPVSSHGQAGNLIKFSFVEEGKRHAAVMLDLDGTVRESTGPAPFPSSASEVRLIEGVIPAMMAWRRKGYALFAVSNQAGVARGTITEEDFWDTYKRTQELLGPAAFDDVRVAFGPVESPERKPYPTMGLELAAAHDLSLRNSFYVGDRDEDAEFAANLSVYFIPSRNLTGFTPPDLDSKLVPFPSKLVKMQRNEVLEDLSDQELLGAHYYAHSAWNKLKDGGKFGDWTKEDVQTFHDRIVRDMERRGIPHDSPLKSLSKTPQLLRDHIVAHKSNNQELHDQAVAGLKEAGIEHPGMSEDNSMDKSWVQKGGFLPVGGSGVQKGTEVLKVEDIVEKLAGHTAHLRMPFVYLTGGLVNRGETEGDIDILLRCEDGELGDKLTRLIQWRILRSLPKEQWDRVEFLFDEDHGPFTSHIPLFALTLTPLEPQEIKMALEKAQAEISKSVRVGSFFKMVKPIKPAKPGQRQSPEAFLELFTGGWPWEVTKKYDGVHVQVHKSGDSVKIFTEDGTDITSKVPGVIKVVKEVVPGTAILDAELEKWDGRTHIPREEAAAFLNSKEGDDIGVLLNVFDMLHNGQDLTGQPLSARRAQMKKVSWPQSTMGVPSHSARLNMAPAVEVKDKKELSEALSKIRYLPGSEGVVAKKLDSTYPTGKDRTNDWVKFHNVGVVTGAVIERIETKTKGVYNYLHGLRRGDRAVVDPVVQAGEFRVVPAGKTFSSDRKFEPGDLIPIEFETFNYFVQDDGQVKVSLWAPRILDEEPAEAPHTIGDAMKIAEKEKILSSKLPDEEEQEEGKEEEKAQEEVDKAPAEISEEVGLEGEDPVAAIVGKAAMGVGLFGASASREVESSIWKSAVEVFDGDGVVFSVGREYEASGTDFVHLADTLSACKGGWVIEVGKKHGPYLDYMALKGAEVATETEESVFFAKAGLTTESFDSGGRLASEQGNRFERPWEELGWKKPSFKSGGEPGTFIHARVTDDLFPYLADAWEVLLESGGTPEFYPHVTILYKPNETVELPKDLPANVQVKLEAAPDKFRGFDGDNGIWLPVRSPQAAELHERLEEEEGKIFTPHITIGYIDDPDRALGRIREIFEGVQLEWLGDIFASYRKKFLEKGSDPYMDAPPEGEGRDYIFQRHFRGKTEHIDFRIKGSKGFLIGWTIADLIAGAIKDPVETVEEAKAIPQSAFKVNLDTGEFVRRPPREGQKEGARAEIVARRKAPEPLPWMEVEGVVPAGKGTEEGISPGATKNFPGVFIIDGKGKLHFGTQKPHFHEYFLEDGPIKGRLMFRQLSTEAIEKGFLEEGVVKAMVTVPSEEQDFKSELAWFAIQPEDQEPYVLSNRASKQGWIPSKGVSALPLWVKSKIPDEFQYWAHSEEKKRKEVRDALRESIKRDETKVSFEKKAESGDFSIQRQTFRGQTVVREGPSLTKWHFTVRNGEKFHFLAEGPDPFKESEASFLLTEGFPYDKMFSEGDVPPGSPLNDTKDTPSSIEVVDRGKATVLIDNLDAKKVEIKGKKINGVFFFRKGEGDIWTMTRSKGPEVE